MNRKIALTFVLLSAAAGAYAETPMVDVTPFKASMTREQVRAELQQAGIGTQSYGESYDPQPAFRSARTRAEVKAEFLADRDQVSAANGEDSGSHYMAMHQQPRTTYGRQLAALPVAE